MASTLIFRGCFAAAALTFAYAALLQPANAGETVSMKSGQYYIQDHAGSFEMGEGHTIIFARWYGTQVNQDAGSAMHHARLDCTGMIDARPDGWDANGYCMHTDRDGDQWVGKWRNGSSMDSGAYEVFRGVSGKYVGASGGGTVTSCTDLVAGPRANMVCDVDGEIVLQ